MRVRLLLQTEDMKLEEKIFMRMRWDRAKMEKYGFAENNGSLVLAREFMDGDFISEISVSPGVEADFRVTDRMNNEEYAQLRNPNYNGSYVNTVRAEYEALLADVAANCCNEASFAAEQSNRIAGMILADFGVSPDFPWDNEKYSSAGVFRHQNTGKWFGLVMNIEKGRLTGDGDETHVDVINLKSDPDKAPERHARNGIYPAYHMNHKLWISVLLNDTLSDDEVMELVRSSCELTSGGQHKMNETLIREVLALADSIPYGHVASYGQIAKLIGREKNSRLVGKIMSMADRYGEHPCHRVVNSSGRTVPGWTEQRAMLEKEGVTFRHNGCVDMTLHQWKPE